MFSGRAKENTDSENNGYNSVLKFLYAAFTKQSKKEENLIAVNEAKQEPGEYTSKISSQQHGNASRPSNKTETESSTVQAYKYTLWTCSDSMSARHGGGEIITEYFIPSCKVIFNEKYFAFHSDKPRNLKVGNPYFPEPTKDSPLISVQLKKEVVDRVKKIADFQTQIDNETKEFKLDANVQALFELPETSQVSTYSSRIRTAQ